MMTTEVSFAYHVTNVPMNNSIYGNGRKALETIKKTWKELEMSANAVNLSYDSPMDNLIEKGVSMSTTLWNDNLPTISPYPKGGEHDNYYFRVTVPLERFRDYRIILCKCARNTPVIQVSILLVNPLDTDLNKRVNDKIAQKEVTELTDKRNYYLFRDQMTKKWYTNNYTEKNKVWVNIVIPHSVDLEKDSEWDTVRHYNPSFESF